MSLKSRRGSHKKIVEVFGSTGTITCSRFGVATWSGGCEVEAVLKASAMGQPTRPTQPSIPPGSVNE